MVQDTAMARKKNPKSPSQSKDRHKPSRLARVKEKLALQLEKLAERRVTNFSDEVNRAVRELLEREGLWPV